MICDGGIEFGAKAVDLAHGASIKGQRLKYRRCRLTASKRMNLNYALMSIFVFLLPTESCHGFVPLIPRRVLQQKRRRTFPSSESMIYPLQPHRIQRIMIHAAGDEHSDKPFELSSPMTRIGAPEIDCAVNANGKETIPDPNNGTNGQSYPINSIASKPPKPKLPGALSIIDFLAQPVVELVEALLVVFSTLFVAIDTLDNLTPYIFHIVGTAGDVVAYIFCVIFGLRWYANAEKGIKYFAKPFVLVDIFVVVLPLFLQILNREHMLLPSLSWLTSQGGLITLRLLRILRLQRVLSSMETFANFQRALGVTNPTDVQPYKLQLARVILSLSTLLSVAAGLIYTTEHEVNPALPDYFTALYFGLTTITTVGFGDITPVTTGGKLVVCGSILAGVAIIPGQAAALFEAVLESDLQRIEIEKLERLEKGAETTATTTTSKPAWSRQAPTLNSSTPQRGLIDAVTPCANCGSTMHWVDATYCWSCGTKL